LTSPTSRDSRLPTALREKQIGLAPKLKELRLATVQAAMRTEQRPRRRQEREIGGV
jgi:hypothetical protein